jgi:hypothetical protein
MESTDELNECDSQSTLKDLSIDLSETDSVASPLPKPKQKKQKINDEARNLKSENQKNLDRIINYDL